MSSITLERSATLASAIATAVAEARERTLTLVRPVSDADLRLQHDPLMRPIIWDLGHIAAFEELWLTRNLDGVIEFSERLPFDQAHDDSPFDVSGRLSGQVLRARMKRGIRSVA